MKAGVPVVVGLMFLATATHADDILAGGALFGSDVQKTAVCSVYNGGTTSVTLAMPRILRDGVSHPLTGNNCSATLGPGRICQVEANIVNAPYSCQTVVGPSKANVRGMFEVRDQYRAVLQNIQLR
jgi:hypothetical protein